VRHEVVIKEETDLHLSEDVSGASDKIFSEIVGTEGPGSPQHRCIKLQNRLGGGWVGHLVG